MGRLIFEFSYFCGHDKDAMITLTRKKREISTSSNFDRIRHVHFHANNHESIFTRDSLKSKVDWHFQILDCKPCMRRMIELAFSIEWWALSVYFALDKTKRIWLQCTWCRSNRNDIEDMRRNIVTRATVFWLHCLLSLFVK